MTSKKISDTEIEITRTETKETVNTYNRAFIEEQIKTIQAQKDRDDAQRDREIAECQEILNECNKLGIKIKAEIIK